MMGVPGSKIAKDMLRLSQADRNDGIEYNIKGKPYAYYPVFDEGSEYEQWLAYLRSVITGAYSLREDDD